MKSNVLIFSVIMIVTASLPTQAAAIDGKLPLCGGSPNCVSSQAQIHDKQHYILPFEIKGKPLQAWAALKQTLRKQPRTVITHESRTTLHSEATSLVFRFVDDINVMVDADAELIHIRSASREGHSDFGVNRKRIETLRTQLRKAGVID